jgi:hypothetical protein
MAAAWSRDGIRTEELPAQSVDQSCDAREAELDQANLPHNHIPRDGRGNRPSLVKACNAEAARMT